MVPVSRAFDADFLADQSSRADERRSIVSSYIFISVPPLLVSCYHITLNILLSFLINGITEVEPESLLWNKALISYIIAFLVRSQMTYIQPHVISVCNRN